MPAASAEQTGTFAGTWVASGKRQPFDFVEGRNVGTFNLAGNVSLKDDFGEIEDFWAECIGLLDSVTGSSVRCVWRSLKGEKAYSVLSGQPLKEGVKVTGEFVGGTGSLSAAQLSELASRHSRTPQDETTAALSHGGFGGVGEGVEHEGHDGDELHQYVIAR